MFSLFARRLPRTTLSAIRLCARGVATETGPTNAVYITISQQLTNKITYPALKEGLATTFGPVERLWLKMPVGSAAIVSFKDQEAAEKLMAKKTLELPPALIAAQNYAGPRKDQLNADKPKLRRVDEAQKATSLVIHNVAAEFGITASDLAQVFSQYGKVSVRQPTFAGYPRQFAFLNFETQEAADNALAAIRTGAGIVLEGSKLSATYSDSQERAPGKYPVLTASA